MNREQRNIRKSVWMAHAFGIGKVLRETGESITQIMQNVRDNEANEFDAYTQIMEELETTLHECGVAAFSEKFLIFMLANAELRKNAESTIDTRN